jgi:glycerate kinase
VRGADVVAELIGLDTALAEADVVLTGEGSLDEQSQAGKVPVAVAHRARATGSSPTGARVFAVAGGLRGAVAELFDDVRGLGREGLTDADALVASAACDLAETIPGSRR